MSIPLAHRKVGTEEIYAQDYQTRIDKVAGKMS
jgi:hypothetical protein